MTGKRRFGRVRRLPSGRWQARYPDASGTLRAAPQTFDRKSDAARWLAAVEVDMSRGVFVDPDASRLSVSEWSTRWLETTSAHLKIKTQAGYASLLKTKILPRFDAVPLGAVKPIMVNEWIADLRRQGFSPSRVRQSYRLLSQIMKAAVANDLIPASPCRGVRLPPMPQTEPHIVSREEADRIIAATAAPQDALVMLLAYGGLRIGEAFAVRRRSIDVIAGSITVAETVVEIEGRLSLDVPKSHQTRVIALPRFVTDRFRTLLKDFDDDDALLFTTRAGGLMHYNYWRRAYFDPAVKAARLSDVTPHDLRASHASWVAQRHGVMAAAARLGHAHASVTTRHYARTFDGQDRIVADDFDHGGQGDATSEPT